QELSQGRLEHLCEDFECALRANIIVDQENRDGQSALWNNIGNLVVLASKIVDQEERKWIMGSLDDYQTYDKYMSNCLSTNILPGDKSHVGIIPLLIFKYKVFRRGASNACSALGLCPQQVVCLALNTNTTVIDLTL
ncbi:MAG: hypothetical protein ACKPKO_62220, partial [Candidatus Fonsibacter sp.]